MKPSTTKEWDELLSALLDGKQIDFSEIENCTAEQRQELVTLLSLQPALREALGYSFVSRMEKQLEIENENFTRMASFDGSSQKTRAISKIISPKFQWLPWGLAATFCITTAALTYTSLLDNKLTSHYELTHTKQESNTAGWLALLVDEVEAEFAEGSGPDEIRFGADQIHLTKGAIHLRFINGADVVMKAPAKFTIHNAMQILLHDGSLRVTAPETAQGFTITAPGIAYEDWGTEFGVTVDSVTGDSEMHVFEGEVNVKKSASSRSRLASLRIGESVTVSDGNLSPSDKLVDLTAFPTTTVISRMRWQKWDQKMRNDPDVVFYYPFQKQENDSNILRNHAQEGGSNTHAKIVGARWVTGRWHGKDALLIDRDTDLINFNLHEELRTFTFATWVNLDRLDSPLIPILNSSGWEQGDMHLQITRSEKSFFTGIDYKEREIHSNFTPVPVGAWVHLAAVIDLDQRTAVTYINGVPAVKTRLPPGLSCLPGKFNLGSWERDGADEAAPWDRYFRGRMDEAILWRRTMTQKEIQALVEAGRPASLLVAKAK